MNPNSNLRIVPQTGGSGADAAQRRENNSLRVLQAAESLFSNSGFFEVSMAQIADTAGVAVGTLYNLFGSKEQLYRTLTHTRTEAFLERVSAAVGRGTSPIDCLDRYIDEMTAMFLEQSAQLRTYLNVMADARLSFSATLAPETRELFEEGNRMLAGFIADGIADGTFRPVDPYRGAVALQAVAIEYLFMHVDDPENHPIEELLPELRAIVIGGLTNSEPRGKGAALAALSSIKAHPNKKE